MLINEKHITDIKAASHMKRGCSPLPLAGSIGAPTPFDGLGVRVAALPGQIKNRVSCGLPPHPRPLSPKGARGEGNAS